MDIAEGPPLAVPLTAQEAQMLDAIPATPFLTEGQAATRLGLSSKTLRNWRALITGPPYLKLGASVRSHISSLDSWALDQEQAA